MEQINKTTKKDIYNIDPRSIVVEAGFNSRTDFGDIAELAEQIKNQGMLNPITVTPFKDENDVEKYRLVDGERRYRATMYLLEHDVEIARIPAIFASKSLTKEELLLQQIMRNEGKPFTEYEYGIAYKKFKDMGFTNAEIAAKVGKKRWHVDCCLAHLERDEKVQELMREGKIDGVQVRNIFQAAKGDDKRALKQVLKLVEIADNKGEKKVSLKDLNFDIDYNVQKDTTAVKKGLSTLFMYIDAYKKYNISLNLSELFEMISKDKKTIKDYFEEAKEKAYNKAQ